MVGGVKVTFQNEQLSKTVTTNNVGVYEADLPLGDYTMTTKGLSRLQVLSPTTASPYVAVQRHPEHHTAYRKSVRRHDHCQQFG